MAWRRTPFVFCCSRSFGTGIPSQFDLDNLAAAINDLAISADYTLANYSANSKQLNFSYLPFQLASRHTFSQRGPRRPHSHSNSKKTKDPQTRQNQARSHPIINESLKRTKKNIMRIMFQTPPRQPAKASNETPVPENPGLQGYLPAAPRSRDTKIKIHI